YVNSLFLFLSLLIRLPPIPTLFPYTTLFRSHNIVITHKRGNFIRSMDTFNFFQTSFHAVVENPAQKADAFHKISPKRIHKNPWKDRKSTRLNSSHVSISYAVFCLKKKKYKIK